MDIQITGKLIKEVIVKLCKGILYILTDVK